MTKLETDTLTQWLDDLCRLIPMADAAYAADASRYSRWPIEREKAIQTIDCLETSLGKNHWTAPPTAREPKQVTRADCLHEAEKCVTGHRAQDYGTVENNFSTIAQLWAIYLKAAIPGIELEIDATDVAMMMALLKIARIATGTATADSFIDLAGYAACGCEIST